jgi:hypothetical protein
VWAGPLPAVGLDGSSAYSVRDLWKVSQKVSIAIRRGNSVHLSSTRSTEISSHEICIVPLQHDETLSENVVGTLTPRWALFIG